jgi:glyceraldehyde-3-phosphate dehydrogenase (NADP+)
MELKFPKDENPTTNLDVYLIDGQLKPWNGPVEEIYSPIPNGDGSKRLLGTYPLMGEAEAMEALRVAKAAYNNGRGQWPQRTVAIRIECVKHFVSLMKEVRDEVVQFLMWEICKSYPDACKEFDRTIEYINDTIKALKDLDHQSSRFIEEQGVLAQIRRAPLGVTLVMGPFNYPLNETFTTLIPALIMGNTVILKTPKIGILLFKPLLMAFQQAFPAGVVNTIFGDGRVIITPIMKSGAVDVLAFIGTSKVAHILKSQHPKLNRLRCVLGLDAKNPAIITPSSDLDLTIKECITGALTFNGQRCTALKLLFVHRSIREKFLSKMMDEMAKLRIGMPWEENIQITPLAEPGKSEFLTDLIKDAVSKGAVVLNGSGGEYNGSLFRPALIADVNSSMRLYHEEQFGPVVPVVTYDHIEEPLDYVLQSNFGQQASIFGQDPDEMGRIIDFFINQNCRININSQCQRGPDSFPFAGRKDSAEGTLSITDALRVFSIRTVISFKQTDPNVNLVQKILHGQTSESLSTNYLL